jgi:hypothetical protein
MPEHGSEYVIYGLGPEGPLGFTAPPVEATPDQPLPDAGPFLRVFSGAEEPSTALLRYGREFIGIWRYVYDHGTGSTKVDDQMTMLTYLVDREAGGHTNTVVFQPDARMNPSSYGQMVAWLAWKYLLMALRQHDSAHADYDAATFVKHAKAFDQLVADVRAGRGRLPENATEVFPPKTVGSGSGEQIDERTANSPDSEANSLPR